MSVTEDQMRTQRILDFEARSAAEPQGAQPVQSGGAMITIHPLGDEPELLLELGLRPEDCTAVDAYWSILGDVVFLQVYALNQTARETGTYARLATYPPQHVNLVVVAEVPFITWAVLEKAAESLLKTGWRRETLTEVLVKLT